MVLRGTQIHRLGQAKCSLVSTRSLPHDLARFYDRAGPFTSADLGGVAGPCLDEVQIWTDSHGPKSFSATRSRRRESRLPPTSCPMPKGLSMYPVIALIVLMLFTWIVAMWASCGENDEPHDEEKPEQSSDEQDHQEAA